MADRSTRIRGGELVCVTPGCDARWSQHAPGGGACEATGCAGFRWVDPAPDGVTYRATPAGTTG